MIKGIFRCDSSFIAICNASVSPSSGTRTGAFMLRDEIKLIKMVHRQWAVYIPNLQSSGSQYSCPFIFCQVRCCHAFFVRLSFTRNTCSSGDFIAVDHILISVGAVYGFVSHLSGHPIFAWFLGFTVWALTRKQIIVVILTRDSDTEGGSPTQERQRTNAPSL